MEALHRQVLPFLLRRMKEDVLQDLPPKIIQDYYCNLSPLQVTMAPNCFVYGVCVYVCMRVCMYVCMYVFFIYKFIYLFIFSSGSTRHNPSITLIHVIPLSLQVQLYEDFAKSRAKASVEDSITSVSAEEEEKPKLKATGHVFQVHWFYSILCRHKMEIHH